MDSGGSIRSDRAKGARPLGPPLWRRQLADFESRNPRETRRLVEEYGVDYRNPFNFTPLMLAAQAGNVDLARKALRPDRRRRE